MNDPIETEAAKRIFALHNGALLGYHNDIEAIIESAIEKATEELQAQLNEARGAYKAEIKSHQRTNDLLKQSRAAHAGEPRGVSSA